MTIPLMARILGKKNIIVKENECMVAFYQNQFLGFFEPGVHALPNRDQSLETMIYDLSDPVFSCAYEKSIRKKALRKLEEHVLIITTGDNEVCAIKNGSLIYEVLTPNSERLLWKDAGDWSTASD